MTDEHGRILRLMRLEVRRDSDVPLRREERRLERWWEMAVRVLKGRATAVGLSHEQLRSWVERSMLAKFPAGHRILSPGEAPALLSTLVSGYVKTIVAPAVYDPEGGDEAAGQRITVQFASPGHVVGLVPTGPRNVRVKFGAVAHTDSVVMSIGRDAVCAILDGTTAGARLLILAYQCRLLSRLIYDKCRLLAADVRTRLEQELVRLARSCPREGSPGTIGMRFCHQDIAELIGACRGSVTRAFGELVDQGLLTVRAGWYTVSPRLLAELSFRPSPHPSARGYAVDETARRTLLESLSWMNDLGIPRDVIRMVADGAELRGYDVGSVIVGDGGVFATMLVSGVARIEAEVASDGYLTAWFAKPGQFIGAGWAGRPDTQVFRAVVHDRCEVAFLRPDLMMKITGMLSGSQFLRYLGYCHETLLQYLYHRCVMLPMETADRLLYQLHVLAAEFPEPVKDGTVIDLQLRPRRLLGSLVAANDRVLGRALAELKQAERIRILPDGRILVVGYFASRTAA
ncbi:MAG: Crp/Fnr family transcriptional regulator [Deltaproteobacteria bacterium]|nr:MAG: Crp/Fnr family transcriptional regulator [Deltaproteobacteria bacterium]